MATRELPFAALRGDGQELKVFSDRVVVRNTGLTAWLAGTDEHTILLREIDDVYLYEGTSASENMLKLALHDAELSFVMGYGRGRERDARRVHALLDGQIHREGMTCPCEDSDFEQPQQLERHL